MIVIKIMYSGISTLRNKNSLVPVMTTGHCVQFLR